MNQIDLKALTIAEILELKTQLDSLVGQLAPVKREYGNGTAAAEHWDWSKSNQELALEHGRHPVTVSAYRTQLDKPKVTRHYPACLSWDWSKSNSAIAREQKIDPNSVRHWRIQLGKPLVQRDYKYVPKVVPLPVVDWEAADWNKPDIQLAKETGYTRERVRQIRAKLGKSRRYVNDIKYERFLEMFKGVTSVRVNDVIDKAGISDATARKYCGRAGIKLDGLRELTSTVHPWNLMNFQLPNKLLGEIWLCDKGTIANHRCNHQLGKPVFNPQWHQVPEQFKALVEAEQLKAAEHRSAPERVKRLQAELEERNS
jgi:hypothetical protein